MAFKFVIFACLAVATNAGLVPAVQPVAYHAPSPVAYHAAAPVAYHAAAPLAYSPVAKLAAPVAYAAAPLAKLAAVAPVAKLIAEEYDAHPRYSFAYGVQDGITGDSKTQQESRDGDVVRGSYSVVDPDGIKRTVEYSADPHNGFNAVVHREHVGKIAYAAAPVAKLDAPVAYAAAPVAKVAAPLAYAAAPVVHAAPVAKVYAAAPVYHHHH